MEVNGQLQAPTTLPTVPTEQEAVSPTTDLKALEKRKISWPYWESHHDYSVIQSVAQFVYRLC